MFSGGGYLHTFHYAAPFAVVAFSGFFTILNACFLPPSQRTTLGASQRALSKHLAAAICFLHFIEGTIEVSYPTRGPNPSARPDRVVYSTLNFLLWLVNYIIQSDAKKLYRLPNLAAWTVALLSDTAITVASFLSSLPVALGLVQLSIGLTRIIFLVILCVAGIAQTVSSLQKDTENEPLLSRVVQPRSLHDSLHEVKHDEEEDDEYVADRISPRSEQEEHLEIVGGWWAYLQEVNFLVPYIVPFRGTRRPLYCLAMFVLMVAGRIAQLFGPRLLGNIVQSISNDHDGSTLAKQILVYIFAVKVPYEIFLEPARKWLSIRLFYGSYLDLLMSLASHVAGLSYSFHENKQTGEIIAAIGQGQVINQFVDDFIESTLPLVLDILIAFAYITYLFDVYVALILASTYVLYGLVTYKGTILCAAARRKYRKTSRAEWNVLHEAIGNWMSTFYLNRQAYQHNRLRTLSLEALDEQAYNYDLSMIMRTFQSLVVTVGFLGILLRTAHLSTHIQDAVGNFVALLFYWTFFTNPLFKLAHFYHSLVQVLVDVERLRQLMQTETSVVDAEGARSLLHCGGKVTYRNVSFSYDGHNQVVSNLDFTIEPGSTVAFVGHSGSGKTTTCDKLLFRAYDVTEGAILIDDQDIRSITQESLRETIGIVRQEPLFNNDTILENVRYARLGASDAEVVAACQDAAIHEQIMRFPMGYNTIVGERGVKLSGGEKQRLAIAQLFLRNPGIVVLDEATSSIDNITESEIQDSLRRICRNRTTILIAHRLSTVHHADQIFVLDKGAVVERGTHLELLANRKNYYQLWNKMQTVKKLKYDLERAELLHDNGKFDCHGFESDDSVTDDDDDAYPADIMQLDGSSSSKQKEVAGLGLRRKLQGLKDICKGNDGGRQDSQLGETDDEEESISPMRVVSPRATDFAPTVTVSPPTSRFSRSKSRHWRSVTASVPTSPKNSPIRTVSAPILPIHVEAEAEFSSDHSPYRNSSQDLVSPSHDGSSPASAPTRIPFSKSTPIPAKSTTARDLLLQSPQSPGRNAALGSHPIVRSAEHTDRSHTSDTVKSPAVDPEILSADDEH